MIYDEPRLCVCVFYYCILCVFITAVPNTKLVWTKANHHLIFTPMPMKKKIQENSLHPCTPHPVISLWGCDLRV
jgi:hypothetical protein